jgi:hypothetical protein
MRMRGLRGFLLGGLVLLLAAMFAVGQVNVSSPTPVKDSASSATGSAAPATAIYTAANSSGNLSGIVACDSSAQATVSTATTTQVVALVAAKAIYVCSFVINGAGSTTAKLVAGTGTNCGTGQVSLTPAFSLATGSTVSAGGGLGYLTKAAAGNALCLTNSAAIAANVFITYTQF